MPDEMPDAGTLIGGIYRVRGTLGSGAMGVVLEAQDESLDRRVAIKFIRASLMDEGFRRRFRSEAQAMARVSHPNVLQIFAFGEHQGAPYFVMEYVAGQTLDAWVAQHDGPPDLETALRLLEQTCDGVAAIHAARTVHRDLKPSNILIDGQLRARVADLGLAVRRNDEGEGPNSNGTKREVVGTPAYMAPEVAFPSDHDAAATGERADVYSLACIAYEVLTGVTPFQAEGHVAMMFQHATVELVRPSVKRPGLPVLLDNALLRALAKRPADRTPTVDAFKAELRAARDGVAEPVRLLVAEDNDDFRDVLELALEIAFPHAAIECVANGLEALAAFDRKRPSVAIIDLLMPELGGLELTGLLRARDPEANMPIIVLTASGGPQEWQRLSAMGADRFLVKPVVMDDVVAMVRRVLKERAASVPPPVSVGRIETSPLRL